MQIPAHPLEMEIQTRVGKYVKIKLSNRPLAAQQMAIANIFAQVCVRGAQKAENPLLSAGRCV